MHQLACAISNIQFTFIEALSIAIHQLAIDQCGCCVKTG